MASQETTPVGLAIVKAEADYVAETPRQVSETILFPYSFDATETVTDILTIISKLNSLYHQKEYLTLETHNLMFSSMGDFQNGLTLYETLNKNSEVPFTLKPYAEDSSTLGNMHHELYELLKFFSPQLTNDSSLENSTCFGGEIIGQTVNILNKEYNY